MVKRIVADKRVMRTMQVECLEELVLELVTPWLSVMGLVNMSQTCSRWRRVARAEMARGNRVCDFDELTHRDACRVIRSFPAMKRVRGKLRGWTLENRINVVRAYLESSWALKEYCFENIMRSSLMEYSFENTSALRPLLLPALMKKSAKCMVTLLIHEEMEWKVIDEIGEFTNLQTLDDQSKWLLDKVNFEVRGDIARAKMEEATARLRVLKSKAPKLRRICLRQQGIIIPFVPAVYPEFIKIFPPDEGWHAVVVEDRLKHGLNLNQRSGIEKYCVEMIFWKGNESDIPTFPVLQYHHHEIFKRWAMRFFGLLPVDTD